MSKLWDELEAARPDCAFIYITHDLEFAAARAARKFVIRDYTSAPTWIIEKVPEETGFSEELTTLILGSRRPILFVEGTGESLDAKIYRACYPNWTIVPCGPCSEVIRSVTAMRNNEHLTRITCSGIVDGDDYEQAEKDKLKALGILVLSVSEVENLFLLPDVSRAIAESEGHVGGEVDTVLNDLAAEIFAQLDNDEKIEAVVVRYCKRRIDRALKTIDLSKAKTIEDIKSNYTTKTKELDIDAIATQRTKDIKTAITDKKLAKLLEYYDNKGLIALAAKHLKNCSKGSFESWVIRSLQNNSCPEMTKSLKKFLQEIEPK